MKKVLIIVCIIFLCCSCQQNPVKNNTSKWNTTDAPTENKWQVAGESNKDITLLPIPQVRSQVDSDYKELKEGKYSNLSTEDIMVKFTESDNIYNLSYNLDYLREENVITGKDIISAFKEFEQIIVNYEGDKYKEGCIYLDITNINDNVTLDTFLCDDKLFASINNGEYNNKRMGGFSYRKEYGKYAIWLLPDYRGGAFEFNNVEQLGYEDLGYYIPGRDAYKIYSKYSNEQDKNDKYRLLTGETVSIQEAIDYIEKEFINKLEIPREDKMKSEVMKVCVTKYEEDAYMLQCFLRNVYNDIPFNYAINDAIEHDYVSEYDMSYVDLIGKEEINYMFLMSYNKYVKQEGEAIEKIIPLQDALTIISNNIGENSQYKVNEISLQYRARRPEDTEDYMRHAYLVWTITAVNENDQKPIKFHVNVVTGELEREH